MWLCRPHLLGQSHSPLRALFHVTPEPSSHTAAEGGSDEMMPEGREDDYFSPHLATFSLSKVSSGITSSRKLSLRPSPTSSLLLLWAPSCPVLPYHGPFHKLPEGGTQFSPLTPGVWYRVGSATPSANWWIHLRSQNTLDIFYPALKTRNFNYAVPLN